MKTLVTFSVAWALFALLASSFASAAIVEHTFTVKNLTTNRLCATQVVPAVNGKVPGPVLKVRENDTVIIHAINHSPYNITLHWHGVFQIGSPWADGPEYVTQCPIRPGQNYTYTFRIIGQEGTLFWHAHFSLLRAYVHGAIIIRPRLPYSYPYAKPYKELPIVLGEWWKTDLEQAFAQIQVNGSLLPASDFFTINGFPGDLYNCSQAQTYNLTVRQGKTYLLRIVNANLISQMFFKIANHNLTVVALDAGYTQPYRTDVITIAPGQTVDVLFSADQPVGSYYMAASPYITTQNIAVDNTTTRGIVVYEGSSNTTTALMPFMPAFNDTPTANRFYTNITGLSGGPHWSNVPRHINESMFITFGLNLDFCPANTTCQGPFGFKFSASMNNQSFVIPTNKGRSMLEASFNNNITGVYTRDFPNNPPTVFNYTDPNIQFDLNRIFAPKVTKVKTLKFNSTVEIILQNTAFIGIENHPIHIHGLNFYVVAQGFGNFNNTRDRNKFNLVNPQMRNTIAVPVGGWAAIRFKAKNPGVWFVHCHIDVHLPWGFAMAFEIENGPTPAHSVPPPPPDLPKC